MLRLQGSGSNQSLVAASLPVRTSEDWVVLDSGKSFAWSAQQQGSPQEQLETLRKLTKQQQQQVQPPSLLGQSNCAHMTLSASCQFSVCAVAGPRFTLTSRHTHTAYYRAVSLSCLHIHRNYKSSCKGLVLASLARHCAFWCALLCALH